MEIMEDGELECSSCGSHLGWCSDRACVMTFLYCDYCHEQRVEDYCGRVNGEDQEEI